MRYPKSLAIALVCRLPPRGGLIFREQGDNNNSIETLKTALSSGGDEGQEQAALYFELAQSMIDTGEKGQAAWCLAKVKALDPEFPGIDMIEGDLGGADPVPVQMGAPAPETGPPPSREQTSWQEAALDQPENQEKEKKKPEQKKRRKISYV